MKGERFIGFLAGLLLCIGSAYALTIPKGTLYFDNSKTRYAAVRFVYGSDMRSETYALAMTEDGDKWRVDIPQTVTNMYRFTFVGGDLRNGLYAQDFNTFKDSISHQAALNRTATSAVQMSAGDIFVPETGDNWAQGSWMNLAVWEASRGGAGEAKVSGTLPVIYIDTKGVGINDTETQVPATVYIDSVLPEYRSLASAAAPLPATIKGRGNYTWRDFDKKPYKLKFDVKQKVLGMPNNRHWCLMAFADDWMGFLKGPAGFTVSRAVGLRWTPRLVPVELVLNGKYQGLYFLTEHVRIASNRVKIVEQEDGENRPDSVTGGWLVEIDNYWSENNIVVWEKNGQQVMISLKEPEVLSSEQRSYLENRLNALNNAIQGNDEADLQRMLDIREAAKFYLVQEIMEDCESYHGSCFLYKDRDSLGVADKWKFGPVWDFGNAYDRHAERWIYDGPTFDQYWIGAMAEFPAFQRAVAEQWWEYWHHHKDEVREAVGAFAAKISVAAKNDAKVWNGTRGYNDNSNMGNKLSEYYYRYDWRINWLYSQWGVGVEALGNRPAEVIYRKVLKDGQLMIRVGDKWFTASGACVL